MSPPQTVSETDTNWREAQVASALDHPNIVTMHDTAETEHQHVCKVRDLSQHLCYKLEDIECCARSVRCFADR